MNNLKTGGFILGLDIGANSIGWALIRTGDESPSALIKTGVRVFEEGVTGDIEKGKDVSRAVDRRAARMRRRLIRRRAYRLTRLARVLQSAGLFPPGELDRPEQRKKFLDALDADLSRDLPDPAMLPYILRARALDEPLEPHQLGRALYHLAQRRGFLSNRKAESRKKDDAKKKEEGEVKEGIKNLEGDIAASSARTLGEFLSRLNPEQNRIRSRYTSRRMYLDEFEAIWNAQSPHHPSIITPELKKKIHYSIFHQRPLKNQRHLVGNCELEPRRKRAPIACLSAQRFRMLQKVNDLEVRGVVKESGEIIRRKLTPDERARLLEKLETEGDVKFSKIKTLLGFSKSLAECRFNFEDGDDKLIGNRTAAKIRKIFGPEKWDRLAASQKNEAVEFLRSAEKEIYRERVAVEKWGFEPGKAKEFAALHLEDGHFNLSGKAIEKLLPLMEDGMPYATARKKLYGDQPAPTALGSLPPLDPDCMRKHMRSAGITPYGTTEVRNPTVYRALTELRKVVNAVVREYGKPSLIRVELARDMKKNRKDREKIHKRNIANRKAREKAKQEMLSEAGISNPKRSDIEKWLLADECEWRCPYTGASINAASLLGNAPRFDVDHIIPFSRCLDNSFMNKTLCDADENRRVKANRTPWEAYGNTPRWDEIIQRVKRFKGDAAAAKLDRFQMQEIADIEGFATQQLNDTRYASRLAVRYLALLYGGGADGLDTEGSRSVRASRGKVTQYLRDEWGLNSILGDGGGKSRIDHRQHAVDAICIALTEPRTVKMLSDAASRAHYARRRRFAPLEEPWQGFMRECKNSIAAVNVSHRVSRKANRTIHQETFYSKPRKDENGKEYFVVRKPIVSLSKNELENIVDPAVRATVNSRLSALGGDPAKAFQDPANHPFIETRSGRRIPIHKVRVRVAASTIQIGAGPRARNVITGNNHHVEIFEVRDRRGGVKWEGRLVTVYEAMRRIRERLPVVDRSHPEGGKFLFSIAGGETISLEEHGVARLYTVRTITTEQYYVFPHAARVISGNLSKSAFSRMNKAMSE
ncbi:MAG: type II CRISPR RNA-guided endonuclease Cas9 [bacterium]